MLIPSFSLFIISAKNCSKPVGGSDMSLEAKDTVSEIFLHDSSVTFVCNDGYEPAGGSAVIRCSAGAWSPLALICKREYLNFLFSMS